MALYKVNSDTADLTKVAGGTLYADNPIGSILPFGGTVIPSGWLLCSGQAISRTEYADLYSVIGTYYGSGNGTTTFNVPDLREATPKGTGLSGKSNNHYSVGGVVLGEFIEDRIQGHWHDVYIRTEGGGNTYTSDMTLENYNNSNLFNNKSREVATNLISDGTNGTPRAGTTTEVKAVGVNFIIKAKHTPVPADFMDSVNDVVETELGLKNITIARVNVKSNSGAWAYKSGKVVNVNFAALVTLDQTTPSGTILYSGFPKPALDIVRFGLIDTRTVDVSTGLVQINSAGNLVADGQGLKTDTAYWGSFTYLTDE